ncbi:hypothetical protein V8G54_002304 [Vigna mungo]|uniref:Uncharacterized protein n=1 Tax=Vigna mungo TaxID=3915 RepID=A0AAQ3P8K1_VIGMU
MAFLHSIFAVPNKCSAILAVKLSPEHAHCSKSHFTIALQQDIHISNNEKARDELQIRHAKTLEEVKRGLLGKEVQSSDHDLLMVDSIQRLGIEHHFNEEIETILKRKELMLRVNSHRNDYQKLSEVALQFRLLRQEGYYIHTDIFDKFWDNNGKLKLSLCEDIDGLIALFEASQLRIEGEDYLDEAEESSRQYLNMWLSRFHDHPQVKVVADALRYPIRKSLPRFTSANALQLQNTGWTSSLKELCRIDAEIMSSLHLKEIFAVSKWWKELALANDFTFARDEPIKWYMWSMACLPDPRLSEARIELTKSLSLVYIIDDIFDFRANIDELTLFTEAVKRWDMAAMEQLPEYMKGCFRALYGITNEFAFRVNIKHGWNPLTTLVKSWVMLMNAFLEEAKWFRSGYVPKAEEYLKNGIVSTGVHMIFVHYFFFIGEGITEETAAVMEGLPTLLSATATILRLCDDLEGDQGDKGDANDGSYMKCYMIEHPEVSIEEARKHATELISNAWKRLNQECLTDANQLPSSFTKVCLNAARMVPLMYSYDTNTPSKLEEYVKSLLQGGALKSVPQDQTSVSSSNLTSTDIM